MPYPVRLPKRTDPADPRVARVVAMAQAEIDKFAAFNPAHAQRAFVAVQWRGNEYRARACYTSSQGTSLIAVVW